MARAKQTKEQTLQRLMQRYPVIRQVVADAEVMHRKMTAYWGEQCPDYEPECPACRAWQIYNRSGLVPRELP